MRPPRPLPFTSPGARPVSAIALRAEGAARTAPPFVAAAGAGAGGRSRRCACLRRRGAADLRRRGPCRSATARSPCRSHRSRRYVADGHRLAALAEDLAQHARPGRRDLQRRLVALDLDQRLVGRDPSPSARFHAPIVASLIDSPSAGTAQRQRHLLSVPLPNASAISRACSSSWRLGEPVAGLADSGRLTHDQWNEPASSPAARGSCRPRRPCSPALPAPRRPACLPRRRDSTSSSSSVRADRAARRARWRRHRRLRSSRAATRS